MTEVPGLVKDGKVDTPPRTLIRSDVAVFDHRELYTGDMDAGLQTEALKLNAGDRLRVRLEGRASRGSYRDTGRMPWMRS